MREFWLVSAAGEHLETRWYPDDGLPEIPAVLAPGKPRLLPVMGDLPTYDLVAEVMEPADEAIEANQITRTRPIRAKNGAEVLAMIDAKILQLEAEYTRRTYGVPGDVAVDGIIRTWHFDLNGVNKVGHILQLYGYGVVTGSQSWKPFETPEVPVTQTGFVQLAAAYAVRDRTNFTILQLLKNQVRALTDPAEVAAFDPTAGWD